MNMKWSDVRKMYPDFNIDVVGTNVCVSRKGEVGGFGRVIPKQEGANQADLVKKYIKEWYGVCGI